MRLVILESPYAGNVEQNVAYARACMLDCLRRGESPMVSHLLYTQVLDDKLAPDRLLGIAAGLEWVRVAEATVVYEDMGISNGMTGGIFVARSLRIPVEFRRLEDPNASIGERRWRTETR